MTPKKATEKRWSDTEKRQSRDDKNDEECTRRAYMYASGDAQVYTAKEKEANERQSLVPPFKSKIQEARFDEFWKAHPKKAVKRTGWKRRGLGSRLDAELFAKNARMALEPRQEVSRLD